MPVLRNAPVGSTIRSAGSPPVEVRGTCPGTRTTSPCQARIHKKGRLSEAGMATAEYAITTLAAVGFAGILVFIMRSDEVRGFLLNLIRTALALP